MNNDLYWSISVNISGYYPSVTLNRYIKQISILRDGTEIRLLQRPEPRFRKICALWRQRIPLHTGKPLSGCCKSRISVPSRNIEPRFIEFLRYLCLNRLNMAKTGRYSSIPPWIPAINGWKEMFWTIDSTAAILDFGDMAEVSRENASNIWKLFCFKTRRWTSPIFSGIIKDVSLHNDSLLQNKKSHLFYLISAILITILTNSHREPC